MSSKLVFKKEPILDEDGNETGEFKRVSVRMPLSKKEIEEIERNQEEIKLLDKKQERIKAYKEAGWHDAFDLIDDILEYGLDVIKEKRNKIKGIK